MFDFIIRLLVWAVEGGAKVSLHPVYCTPQNIITTVEPLFRGGLFFAVGLLKRFRGIQHSRLARLLFIYSAIFADLIFADKKNREIREDGTPRKMF